MDKPNGGNISPDMVTLPNYDSHIGVQEKCVVAQVREICL
jgi:hypothetical protein